MFIYLFAYLVCMYVLTYTHMQVHATAWVWRSEDYLWEVFTCGRVSHCYQTSQIWLLWLPASSRDPGCCFLELDHKVKWVPGLKPRPLCLCG